MKRAIQEYFPIVDINLLAVPERNAFKPIYKMHKWFARRSSSVFRAILLGTLKPAGTDIMKEFYKDHTHDPDTNGKVILDPFMGGGTTVVEALRLGCKVIGIDLNPVAWFIVKTEVERVDLSELEAAFDRLAKRPVDWSGKPLKETLLELYKTECPACGNPDADIIYTFWVKSAPCTTATCDAYTLLFNDYIVARKSPSIRYFPDCVCPQCEKKFDWEREPAAMIGEPKLMQKSAKFSAGEGRSDTRWTYSNASTVACPWCQKQVKPQPASSKLKRKKVPLAVLLCPHCEEVWQFRGPLPEQVRCPTCKQTYDPKEGNLPARGKFTCRGSCGGNVDKIITAIRMLSEEQLLPTRPYALEGYCEACARAVKSGASGSLFDQQRGINQSTLLWKNNGKFFKRISPQDLSKYQEASEIWRREKDRLPYPRSEIPDGAETHRLLEHHYFYWHQMFNDRQLLALSTLLRAIDAEADQVLKEMLLCAFSNCLNDNNMFCRFAQPRNHLVGVFARHDYQPKSDPLEGNIWGIKYGHGGFSGYWEAIIKGKKYIKGFQKNNCNIFAQSSTNIPDIEQFEAVVTDPPYSSNVNYSELGDFFYVWLRLVLKNRYSIFAPELTAKAEEIIENKTRGKSSEDFKKGLQSVFRETRKFLKDEGLLVFTFHHSKDSTWESLLEALCDSGYFIEAVYPIHGEAENTLHLMGKEAISYDLIHVCRRQEVDARQTRRSWAGVRHEIRKRAREEARLIESGRYGNEPLSPADANLLLIGKCLELYSKHYGAIVDHEDKPVPLKRALEEIKMLVDQIVSRERPLPAELENIDPPSYIYFTTLCSNKEIKSDDVSKSTRGIVDPGVLREHGLIIKGREKRGRTFEVKQPLERLNDLKQKFQKATSKTQLEIFSDNDGELILQKNTLFVDYVHFLLGLAEVGENILPWLERFRGLRPQIRAACEYLMARNKAFESPAKKILGLLDERNLFNF